MSSSSEPSGSSAPPHRLHIWWPVLLWLLVIAMESTSYFGADRTYEPLRRIFTWFHGPFRPVQWWHWHHTIRKIGHLIGYGILGLTFFRARWLTLLARTPAPPRRILVWAFTLPCVALVASLDELHQLFLPNRTGLFSDVLIDTTGAVVALLLTISWNPKSSPESRGPLA